MRGIKKIVIVLAVTALLAPAVAWASEKIVETKGPEFQNGPCAKKLVFRHDDSGMVEPFPPGRVPGIKPVPPPQTLSSQTTGVVRLGMTPGVQGLVSVSPQQKLESRLKNLALELR